jgi:riboflavin kinase / FMN adenylyltransferase
MTNAIEKELAGLTPTRPTLVSVGVFDGLHLGHQTLIKRLVDECRSREILSAVVTFRQHPMSLLEPNVVVPALTSLTERVRLIRQMGVDIIVTLNFTHELAEMGAQPFVLLLQQHLKMHGMILGWDFALGRHREGSLAALHDLGERLGFTTEIVGPVKLGGEVISSTSIRKALTAGDIAKANAMLGRPFSLEGTVVSGEGRGTALGFPTANLDLDPALALPSDGVYATFAHLDGANKPSATFIGTKHTFGGTERVVEVHIIGHSGELYRRTLRIDIMERLRGVEKFPNPEQLITQINKDVAQAAEALGGKKND